MERGEDKGGDIPLTGAHPKLLQRLGPKLGAMRSFHVSYVGPWERVLDPLSAAFLGILSGSWIGNKSSWTQNQCPCGMPPLQVIT